MQVITSHGDVYIKAGKVITSHEDVYFKAVKVTTSPLWNSSQLAVSITSIDKFLNITRTISK